MMVYFGNWLFIILAGLFITLIIGAALIAAIFVFGRNRDNQIENAIDPAMDLHVRLNRIGQRIEKIEERMLERIKND